MMLDLRQMSDRNIVKLYCITTSYASLSFIVYYPFSNLSKKSLKKKLYYLFKNGAS